MSGPTQDSNVPGEPAGDGGTDAFGIQMPVTSASLDEQHPTASLEVDVTNALGRRVRAGVEVLPEAPATREWVSLAPATFDLDLNESQRVEVTITPPADPPAGEHGFVLRAFDVDQPADAFTKSPRITVSVPEGDPRPTPWWVYAAAAVVLVGIVGVILAIVLDSDPEPGPVEPSPVASVPVAAVVGTEVADAENTLEEEGFETVVATDESVTSPADGCVLLQHPPGETEADEGSTVALMATSCPEPDPNPTLVAPAQALVEADFAGICEVAPGFCQAIEEDPTLDVESFQADQTPSPALVEHLDEMTQLFLLAFTTDPELPNLQGQSLSSAVAALEELGLSPVLSEEPDPDRSCPFVRAQLPAPGTPVPDVPGGSVAVFVDYRPPNECFVFPPFPVAPFTDIQIDENLDLRDFGPNP